ncbi:hypothetical protein VSP10_10310 [Myroides odoratimimus]|uniref:hypothetical protein n=1 Tax=Myroides odoratimimus TaxID=76832 RepID=UPI0003533C6A|nr:hypothetical protein [Myroides odoratimimus]EPH13805.1 hypothetical protein HMPREF9713_00377 [Myroides odoratimimus CCUG 12700]MDM1442439.1 hypothetical protein [Myroides odoratimimus]MDO5858738.1 hypothetical protein [Myroides odoratimimus]MEC4053188.1 hypothetical protein [Myroides odoratimimus]SHL50336.1 hypothetical protein SAMN05444275_104267 [Myroides odoratimimus subsp. xuanwuensis]
MEMSYIVVPLVDCNENAFNQELSKLFPMSNIVHVVCHQKQFLVVYRDIDTPVTGAKGVKEVCEYDNGIESFSKRHPYLDIAVLQVLGEEKNCFYDGFIMKNKKKIKEHSGMHNAYIPILQYFMPDYDGSDLSIFSSNF